VESQVLAAFATLLTPLTALAAYIAMMYRKRIAELESEVREREARERRILAVVLRSAEDEERLVQELIRTLTGEDV